MGCPIGAKICSGDEDVAVGVMDGEWYCWMEDEIEGTSAGVFWGRHCFLSCLDVLHRMFILQNFARAD